MGFACVDIIKKHYIYDYRYENKKILIKAESNSNTALYNSMILSADCLILNTLPFFSNNRKYTLNHELGIKDAFLSHITGRNGNNIDLVWFNGYEFNDSYQIVCSLGLPIIIMYSGKKYTFMETIQEELRGSITAHSLIPDVYYSKVNNTYTCHISDLHKVLQHIGITPSHNILMAVKNYAQSEIINTLKDYHAKPHTKKIEIS